MKRIVLLLGCLAVMPSVTQAGELFRWIDAQGNVHYGDAPPADATQIEPLKFPAAITPGEDLPYATRRAQQNFPVTLYVAENCTEYCDKARNLLIERGIPFAEKTLQTQEELDAFKALSGSSSVPTLRVGRSFLKGFLAEQWHNELDIADYPKTAPYRAPRTPPPAPAAAGQQAAPANPESAGEVIPDSAAGQ
ncbi:MAG: glutaredoxin family protein [Gallionellaceae bacterium]|nr:glutaredoxin family protein [Gallionellaceae bacterium]